MSHGKIALVVIDVQKTLDEWEAARELLMSGQAPGKILITIGLQ